MYVFLKRVFDLFVSVSMFIMLLPIFIIVVPILKFTGEGEIFFLQKRVGLHGNLFNLFKFATMLKDSPNTGTVTAKNDPRILPMGKFLRNTKINELPQILNVLFGSMSLVGWRPLTEEAFSLYSDDIKEVILKMKPGVTGIGSIIFRNEEEILYHSKKEKMVCYAEDILPLKGALEKWYFSNRSILLDFKIVLATGLIVLFPKNNFILKWFDIVPLLEQSPLRQHFNI